MREGEDCHPDARTVINTAAVGEKRREDDKSISFFESGGLDFLFSSLQASVVMVGSTRDIVCSRAIEY